MWGRCAQLRRLLEALADGSAKALASLPLESSGASDASLTLRPFASPEGARNAPAHSTHLLIHSSSRDIRENLALEEALLRATKFTSTKQLAAAGGIQSILLTYRNDPCVVIGRNQCAWTETSAHEFLAPQRHGGVKLARRHSGGGAVFHDEGNACFSFLTHRDHYDPAANMRFLMDFLARGTTAAADATLRLNPVELSCLHTSKRHDLFITQPGESTERVTIAADGDPLPPGRKLSGSAMKLGRDTAYHHCTLLVTADTTAMSANLRSPLMQCSTMIKNVGVASVRSPVTSLVAEEVVRSDTNTPRDALTDSVIAAVGRHYENTARAAATRIIVDMGASFAHTAFVDQPLPNGKPPKVETTTLAESAALGATWDWLFAKGPQITVKTDLRDAGVALVATIAGGSVTALTFEPLDDLLRAPESATLNALLKGVEGLNLSLRPGVDVLEAFACALYTSAMTMSLESNGGAIDAFASNDVLDGAIEFGVAAMQRWLAECRWRQ